MAQCYPDGSPKIYCESGNIVRFTYDEKIAFRVKSPSVVRADFQHKNFRFHSF